jgi:hypothetical protein
LWLNGDIIISRKYKNTKMVNSQPKFTCHLSLVTCHWSINCQWLIFLTFLLLFSNVNGQNHSSYPSYEQVVTNFFDKYSIKDLPKNSQVKFEKRATGWHVAVLDYYGEKRIKNELYWSSKKKKFLKIDFKKLKDKSENEEQLQKYLKEYGKIYYNISPFYGYRGWYMDVVNELENSQNLPDSTLYALGRAYSSYASSLLHDNNNYADTLLLFDLKEGMNSMTGEQLRKYRYYRHKAIEKFKELEKLNPRYETIVGLIGVKANNEHLTSFLDLRTYQNEEEAQKELPDDLYNDFYLAAARNYLISCPANAILFTNGDNDTYPLLYVQAKHGFRPDVLVVNVSLLLTSPYINSLRDSVLTAPGLPVSFTPEQIAGTNRELIIMENEDSGVMELQDMINYLKVDSNIRPYGSTQYFQLAGNKFRLTENEKSMEWEMDGTYFYRSHLMILDVIANSFPVRPICFAVTLAEDYFVGLRDYMKWEGLAYRLTSEKNDPPDEPVASVNTTVMYDNMMNKFDWSGLKKVISHEKLFGMNYRNLFNKLAEALLNENKPDSARAVLDKSLELLPDSIMYYDLFQLPVIESYYKLKEFDKANQIAKILAHNLKENLHNYHDITSITPRDQRFAILERLKEIVKEYGQEGVVE